jgi:precorrin-6x reductase
MVEDAYQVSYQKLSGMRELDIPVSMIKKQAKKMEKQNEQLKVELMGGNF